MEFGSILQSTEAVESLTYPWSRIMRSTRSNFIDFLAFAMDVLIRILRLVDECTEDQIQVAKTIPRGVISTDAYCISPQLHRTLAYTNKETTAALNYNQNGRCQLHCLFFETDEVKAVSCSESR